MPVKKALKFALGRAAAVLLGGMAILGMYIMVIIVGPSLEGRWFPVVTDYKMDDVRVETDGGISFVPEFNKVRNCTYFGVTWFASDPDGSLVRIQLKNLTEDPSAPRTGPVGKRVGVRQVLYPPTGTKEIFGIMHHSCSLPWQTRTVLGPFKVLDGDVVGALDTAKV